MLQVFHGFSKNNSIEPKESSHLETENDDESNVQLADKFSCVFFSLFSASLKNCCGFFFVLGVFISLSLFSTQCFFLYICFSFSNAPLTVP